MWVNDKPTEARKELRKYSYEHGRLSKQKNDGVV